MERKGKELANLEPDLIKDYVFVLFMKLSARR
jgi:hypothetical protein